MNKNLTLGLCIAALLLAACAPSAASVGTAIAQTQAAIPTATIVPSATQSPQPTATNTAKPSSTAAPTNTTQPTNTPPPTNTPKPTATDTPAATPTPLPQPILLQGHGDAVVNVDKWTGVALANISYKGGGNFAVWNDDADNNHIDLLVNRIGTYTGTVLIDIHDADLTKRFEITASGTWSITVSPLDSVRREKVPATIVGYSDDVIYLDGAPPDTLIVDASEAKGNFVIFADGKSHDLLVNEIAPYSGTVLVPKGALVLEVLSERAWSIQVTTR